MYGFALRIVRDLSRKLNIPIICWFCASYHGKGWCDGHFAVGKYTHARKVVEGDELIVARDFVDLHNTTLKNTYAEEVAPDRAALDTYNSMGRTVVHGAIKKNPQN